MRFFIFIVFCFLAFVIKAQPTFTLSLSVCEQSSLTINSNNGMVVVTGYTWTANPSGPVFSSPNNSITSVSFSLTGSYTINLATTSGTNTYNYSNTVTVNPLPVLTVTGNTVICSGQSTTLTANGASTYTWQPSGFVGNPMINSPSAGRVYTLTGRNNTGCIRNRAVNVTVNPSPIVFIASISSSTICSGVTTTITASGASTYSLNNVMLGNSRFSVSPTASTVYSITGSDVTGCISAAALATVVVNSLPILTVTGNTVICSGQSTTLTASGASTYSWFPGASTVNWIIHSSTPSMVYTVTGTNNTGCVGNQTVSVTANASPTVSVVGTNTICEGGSTLLNANGANTYLWNTSAITPNISINPTITTTYSVTGTDLNNCTNTQTISVIVDNTCQDVWPGDANSDGIANNIDVLELGLHYAQTGSSRTIISNNWQPYSSTNWSGTITNGKNMSHSDCNGDGIISQDDTLAIYANYGLAHTFKIAQNTGTNTQLSIIPDQTMVVNDNWGSSSIYLGDVSNPVNMVNGLAYTIDFDPTVIEPNSIYITYDNSFIDPSKQNLHFRKLNFTNGKIYTATTHTNNTNVSGYGKIATLHYKIKSNLATNEVLNLSITQANQSNASGNITPLSSGAASVAVIGFGVGLGEVLTNNIISISPNPTDGIVSVISTHNIEKIEITTLAGQILKGGEVHSNNYFFNANEVSNGVYFIKIYLNNKQIVVKKMAINR